jgi:hypothetical protein
MTKSERIARSRADLDAKYRANPEAVLNFEARKAKLVAAAKRERERFEILVMGGDRPAPTVKHQRVRGKKRSIKVPATLDPEIERALAERERWSHKSKATPQTMAHAERTHQGALSQLHANGVISAEELEWTAQIANVHRSIAAGVDVAVASLEARVDQSTRPPSVGERIHRVRMHAAYTLWRSTLPAPKAMILDMIVGDAVGYTVAARRYRVHNRKAKRVLLEAIQRWPLCVIQAFAGVDDETVRDMNEARPPRAVPLFLPTPAAYEQARRMEPHPDATDEPYLLPAIDPAFLDENGLFLPWEEVAAVVRAKFAAAFDESE